MNNLIPENSYLGKCSCGAEYLAPKGTLHCTKCLYSKITELEKENAELLSLSAMSDLKKSLAIRDLEQRAKGVEDAIEWLVTHYPNECNPSAGLLTYFLGGLNKRIRSKSDEDSRLGC